MLDAMAAAIERSDPTAVSLEQLPPIHADERLSQDYELREVVAEYCLLRRVILDIHAASSADMPERYRQGLPPLVTLNRNIDCAIIDAVDRYTVQRDRMRDSSSACSAMTCTTRSIRSRSPPS